MRDGKRDGRSHRGRLDIIADILNASHGGAKKSCLMYRCNLSFKQLKYYLSFLLGRELLCMISHNGDSNISLFGVTDKGKKFMKAYKRLLALMN